MEETRFMPRWGMWNLITDSNYFYYIIVVIDRKHEDIIANVLCFFLRFVLCVSSSDSVVIVTRTKEIKAIRSMNVTLDRRFPFQFPIFNVAGSTHDSMAKKWAVKYHM